MKNRLVAVSVLFSLNAAAQNAPVANFHDDSTAPKTKYLSEITVVGRGSKSDYQQLPEIVGTSIYAGKKNALIVMDNVQGNVVMNNMRQVLAKVPGVHVWESDPSGVQIGIAARGLSPNRSWEFNIRQNGYDIAADPFGYPEAYYNPQLQSVQRIEIIRGQGALQYGPQFGGMVNYILRNGSEINKPVEFETQQTFGSNNLFNSYNAIGGTKGKVHYYSFFDHRAGDGWRRNSRFYTNNAFGTVTYKFTPRFSLTAEVMHSHSRMQQPGGLSDSALYADTRQSLRSRNWMDIRWITPAMIANYQINEKARITTRLYATIGDRNSVGFFPSNGILGADTILASSRTYNNRTVFIDQYRNYGLESRFITDYYLLGSNHTLSGGIRGYVGNTFRRNNGKGTTGSEYDLTISGNFATDIDYQSQNAAAFVENVFRFGQRLLIIPGLRYEWLRTTVGGRSGYAANGSEILLQNQSRQRGILLAGVGAEYHLTKNTEFYANYSQAYRPMHFAELTMPISVDVIDPNLADATGYNVDLGYRGKVQDWLQFDVSGFLLRYNNRVGTLSMRNPDNSTYRLVTNAGNSTSRGVEAYVEVNPVRALFKGTKADLILFTSYGYTDARYSNEHKVEATRGKRVENAPRTIVRSGITGGYHNWLLTAQVSHVGESFADANNTILPTANGQAGLIPSYTLTDLTATYKISKQLNVRAGVNNLFDKRYFTRRAGGYPGPGAMPGDGRTAFISIGAKF